MADAGDKGKYKRKISRKLFQKSDREFDGLDTMRAPVIHVLPKPPSDLKSGPTKPNHHHHHHDPWDKRGSGARYYDDGDKRGSGARYYDDGDKRGSSGDKRSGLGSVGNIGILRSSDSSRNSLYSSDMGRPPGVDREELGSGVLTPTPVILSRARSSSEQRSTSPNAAVGNTAAGGSGGSSGSSTAATAPSIRKESVAAITSPGSVAASSAAQQYHIAAKPHLMEGCSVVAERSMKGPLRLLDETLSLCDDLTPYLVEQSNYLVVAVMGLQGVGKSSLASLLVDPNANILNNRSCTFRPESFEQIMSACHGTNGMEIYITAERLMVIDCQPLLSASIMDRLITHEKKFISDYNSTENSMEIKSLQLLTLALSIAHVVILVQDSAADPTILRLLQTCEMMKPPLSSSSSSAPSAPSSSAASSSAGSVAAAAEDGQQYFPHVVFVYNRAPIHHFSATTLKRLQAMYQQSFLGSCLETESRVGLCNGLTYTPLLQTSCGGLINLFLLPDLHQTDPNPAVSFSEVVCELRRQVLAMRRLPLTHLTFTEKTWYQYVCRTWEHVRNWSLFMEYSRLLP